MCSTDHRVVLLLLAGSVFATGVLTSFGRQTSPAPICVGSTAVVLVTVAPTYEREAWLHGGERFPAGAKILAIEANRTRGILSDFAAVADPSVSFDGSKILFAGRRRAGDPWQIWEAGVADGEKPTLIVACSSDCIRPLYLPENRVVYAHKVEGHFQLESASTMGTGTPLRLSYVPGNFLPSDILRDGRILFQAAFPLGGEANSELYAVYSDGSGVESYRCDHHTERFGGKQLASGDIVFASNRALARFTSSLAQQAKLTTPIGQYDGAVAEIDPGHWLLPWRPSANVNYRLQTWESGSGTFRQSFADPHANVVEPSVLAPHRIPNRHPSGLHTWSYANLLCLNAHLTKDEFTANSLTSVRFYEMDASGKRRLLGSSLVQADGSFFVQVPGNRPLQIELLDSTGRAIHREKGWFWMRPGEQRICVGCHAGPERAPENVLPEALRGLAEPVKLTGRSGPTGFDNIREKH